MSDGISVPQVFTGESGFFAKTIMGYDRAGLNRMNARHHMFMAPFADEFQGKTVLDIASHDGRWSWAALNLGARHVTGIEARGTLIEKGRHLFEGKYREAATFIEGDIFDVMPDMVKSKQQFDIVLCLGIFYHIMDHYTLLKFIRQLNPKLVILDTGLMADDKPYIHLETEATDNILNAIGHVDGIGANVIGLVSVGGLRMICQSLGFSIEYIDWLAPRFADTRKLEDYVIPQPGKKQRYTAILRPL